MAVPLTLIDNDRYTGTRELRLSFAPSHVSFNAPYSVVSLRIEDDDTVNPEDELPPAEPEPEPEEPTEPLPTPPTTGGESPSSPAGSGGGGAAPWYGLLLLALTALWRRQLNCRRDWGRL